MFGLKYKNRIEELEALVTDLTNELFLARNKISRLENPPEPPKVWKRGDRVRGSKTCGFNASMNGTVQFVEPTGKVWVHRDGSSGDVFYAPHELEAL